MPGRVHLTPHPYAMNDTSHDHTEALKRALERSTFNVKAVMFGLCSVVGTIPTCVMLLANYTIIRDYYRQELENYAGLRSMGINPYNGVGMRYREILADGSTNINELLRYHAHTQWQANPSAAPPVVRISAARISNVPAQVTDEEATFLSARALRTLNAPPSYQAAETYGTLPVTDRARSPAPAYEETPPPYEDAPPYEEETSFRVPLIS